MFKVMLLVFLPWSVSQLFKTYEQYFALKNPYDIKNKMNKSSIIEKKTKRYNLK